MIDKVNRLPFANYDVVVYFGVGIFSLPLVSRYSLLGRDVSFPPIFGAYSDGSINLAVSLVALAFGVYILGHAISLMSSFLIEQFIYRIVGPPSHVISRTCIPSAGSFSFRRLIRNRIASSYRDSRTNADIVRLIANAPVLPIYTAIYVFGFFGFYQCKISPSVVLRVFGRLRMYFDLEYDIINDKRWFKVVEYACANDHAVASAKMYNYLVIYGLFRSLSLVFLVSIWFELFYWWRLGGIGFVDQSGPGNPLLRVVVLYGAYGISLMGYGKFSRRYAEEAVQAFGLSMIFDQKDSGAR
ncbi:hypothetical protein [Sphingosinithalassobacter sp. LHW66-3]|uniref:hypothetical protein n=1 Tax=Sphingosinithalassobacter sp. LHW66-3 TaxID=3424718 RepID=UPI003D6BFE1A